MGQRSWFIAANQYNSDKAAPMLLSMQGGLARLIERLHATLATATIRTDTQVLTITSLSDGRYSLRSDHGPAIIADGVVLAVPARAAATILYEMAPELSTKLETISSASVVTVTLAYPISALPGPLE